MTEKEKAKEGLLYDANYDEELKKERIKCKELCYEYNMLNPTRMEKREELLKKIMGKTADIIITKIGLFANLIIERLTEPLTILVVHLKIHLN